MGHAAERLAAMDLRNPVHIPWVESMEALCIINIHQCA